MWSPQLKLHSHTRWLKLVKKVVYKAAVTVQSSAAVMDSLMMSYVLAKYTSCCSAVLLAELPLTTDAANAKVLLSQVPSNAASPHNQVLASEREGEDSGEMTATYFLLGGFYPVCPINKQSCKDKVSSAMVTVLPQA